MASKKEIGDRILAVLRKKMEHGVGCPLCGKATWLLNADFISLPVTNSPRELQLGGEILPLVPITCTTCGNTQMLNLLVLGFSDLDSLRFEAEAEAQADKQDKSDADKK